MPQNKIDIKSIPVAGLHDLPDTELTAAVRQMNFADPRLLDAVTSRIADHIALQDDDSPYRDALDALTDTIAERFKKYIPRWLRPFMGRIDEWVDNFIYDEGKELVLLLLLKLGRKTS